MGQGLLISCFQSLYSTDGDMLGVAGIDFSFQYIVESLLPMPVVKTEEAMITDSKGNILLSTNSKVQPSRKLFPVSRVVKAIQEGQSGYFLEWSVQGERMIVYQKIESLDWYYIVTGSPQNLLLPAE